MAILRGGRRIGGFDIRLGIPRDRSLDNVNGDKRLKRRPGGDPTTTLNNFIAEVNQGEGFSRPSRYLVRFFPPSSYKLGSTGRKAVNGPPPVQGFQEIDQSDLRQNVGMMCDKVTMPSRDINTTENIMYGPGRAMPYSYSYPGTIECTFYADKFLRQRIYFEEWQKMIMDTASHNMKFYDDYVGTIDILQLGEYESNADKQSVTYGVRLYECYPQTISGIDYSYGATDQVVKVPVTFNFRNWRNLTTEQVNGATIGKSYGDIPTVKASNEFGLFGGILNKLPPELRRAGRDVLSQVKRSAPIGRITGGRVFPPIF